MSQEMKIFNSSHFYLTVQKMVSNEFKLYYMMISKQKDYIILRMDMNYTK